MRQGALAAGIFDMDGVLLDSEPLHHAAVNQILAAEGCAGLSFEEYVPYMGTTDEFTWNDLIRRFALKRPLAYYRDQYDVVIMQRYRGSSEIAPGAAELLQGLRGIGLPLAVASSSRGEWVEICLASLRIRPFFDVVVSGDAVSRSKPDPEIYLLAAAELGTPASACFAVEDSPNGVAAALAAGMLTIAVESPYTRGQDTEAAHVHLRSLADFNLALVRGGTSRLCQIQ